MKLIVKETEQLTKIYTIPFDHLPALHGWRIDDFEISSKEMKLAIQKHGQEKVMNYLSRHLLIRMKP